MADDENRENSEEIEEPDSEEKSPSPGPSCATASTADGATVHTSTANFDITNLTYESLFDALASFEQSLGLTEANACTILIELLRSSAKTPTERATVETVASGLEKIAALEYEVDKQERMRKLVSEKMKLKRLFETPEQRAQRLERMRARYRSSKTGEPCPLPLPMGGRREKNGLESETAKEERLRKLREYQRRRLERELPEQRERRLAKMRLNQKLRRERQNQQKQLAGGIVGFFSYYFYF